MSSHTAQTELKLIGKLILEGELKCGGITVGAGEFCLVPAELLNRQVEPAQEEATLLRITIPESAD